MAIRTPIPSNRRPRVLLADDHTMLLEAFRRLLEPTFDVIGAASDGRTLVEMAVQTNPDVVVMDISMPRLNGIEAGVQLRQRLPAVKIVFLTVNEDPDVAAAAIRLGASGFLLKSCAATDLTLAIQAALAGKTFITSLITRGKPLGVFLRKSGKPAVDKLTSRQREVLQLLAEGRPMKEVGDILKLTPRTVAFHKYAMMERLGFKTGAELVQYAVAHQIVAPRG